jgi:phosphomannomutase
VADYNQLVKAYDIRGTVPDAMNADVARDVGMLFAALTQAPLIAVAYDMRESSPGLADAFAEGAASAGTDIVIAGLGSTDYAYYVSGMPDIPAAMITASHNPAQYNGIKLCRAGASPVGEDTGLAEIRAKLTSRYQPVLPKTPGKITRKDLTGGYVRHLRSLVPLDGIRPLKLVVDAGNGMAGYMAPKVFDGLPLDVVPLYFELDGTFPNHEASAHRVSTLTYSYRCGQSRRVGLGAGASFDSLVSRPRSGRSCGLTMRRSRLLCGPSASGHCHRR